MAASFESSAAAVASNSPAARGADMDSSGSLTTSAAPSSRNRTYSWSNDAATQPVAIVVSGDSTNKMPATPAVVRATSARRSTQTKISATKAWLATPIRCDSNGADSIHSEATPCCKKPIGRIG